MKSGYTIHHFAGKEITINPKTLTHEILKPKDTTTLSQSNKISYQAKVFFLLPSSAMNATHPSPTWSTSFFRPSHSSRCSQARRCFPSTQHLSLLPSSQTLKSLPTKPCHCRNHILLTALAQAQGQIYNNYTFK